MSFWLEVPSQLSIESIESDRLRLGGRSGDAEPGALRLPNMDG